MHTTMSLFPYDEQCGWMSLDNDFVNNAHVRPWSQFNILYHMENPRCNINHIHV